jgi:hypothetical protein
MSQESKKQESEMAMKLMAEVNPKNSKILQEAPKTVPSPNSSITHPISRAKRTNSQEDQEQKFSHPNDVPTTGTTKFILKNQQSLTLHNGMVAHQNQTSTPSQRSLVTVEDQLSGCWWEPEAQPPSFPALTWHT